MKSYSKLDITNRVYGKMNHNHMTLYLDQQEIGYLTQGTDVVLRNGFLYESEHFYQLFETGEEGNVDQYVSNCDQGWC